MSGHPLKNILWDYKRSFFGLPAILKMSQKFLIPPVVIFGTYITVQYLLPPNTYYDEYDGTASQYTKTK